MTKSEENLENFRGQVQNAISFNTTEKTWSEDEYTR